MNDHCHRKFRFLMPVFAVAALGVFTFAVHALWNGVLTDVTGVKPVTYWQALGILVLAKILFGGFPGRGGRCFGPPWRHREMMEEWASLPPEQREQMRADMRKRFGSWPRPCRGGDESARPGEGPGAT